MPTPVSERLSESSLFPLQRKISGMPEVSNYEYVKDCSAVKELRTGAEWKLDEAGSSGDCFSKKKGLLLIFGLVVLATFFAILSLIMVTVKVSGIYSEMTEVQDKLMLQLSQFKGNVSEEGQRNKMDGELSKLKTNVSGELQKAQGNMTDLISKLKMEMSGELQKAQGNMTDLISKLKLEMSEELQKAQGNMTDLISELKLEMFEEVQKTQSNMTDLNSKLKLEMSGELQKAQGNMTDLISKLKLEMFEEVQKTQSNMTDLNSKLKLEMFQELQKIQSNMIDLISKLKLENSSRPQCPSNWVLFNLHCYYFTTNAGSWHFGKGQCAAMHSRLVSITSVSEQSFIKRDAAPELYWIGLTDSETERTWKWEDGSDYKSTPKFWAAGEPNDAHSSEDCAHVDSRGNWNDIRCTTKLRWICEKNAE